MLPIQIDGGTFQPKQAALLDLLEATGPDVPTILAFCGARGSAKSRGLRNCALYLAGNYPGIVIYIVRRVLKDLLENHAEKMALEQPQFHARYYRQSRYEWELDNGSRIVMVYAENAVDVQRVSYGPECTFLLIDQAEQFTENELTSFRICNRWPSAARGFVKTCLFFNIGVSDERGLPALSMQYLRRIFHLRQFHGKERPADYHCLIAYGWDNYEWFRGQVALTEEQFYALSSQERYLLFINHTSEGHKMDALPAHRREGELLGNWDAFSGQYFADVWGDHCVLDIGTVNALIQPWWRRWMAQDWGFGDHDYHCWLAIGKVSPELWIRHFGGDVGMPLDVIILYRELLQNGRAEGDLAMDIANATPEAERPFVKDFWLSQDAFGQRAKQGGANTVGEAIGKILHRHKLPWPTPARQDRINGWRCFYNCLRQAGLRGCNIDRERAQQGPAFFVSANCPAAIEHIPLGVRDPDNPEDMMKVSGAVWEDVLDGLRYGLYSMLEAKKQAPVEVRAHEVYAAASSPTDAHLRMLHFQEKEMQRTRVSKQPRWR